MRFLTKKKKILCMSKSLLLLGVLLCVYSNTFAKKPVVEDYIVFTYGNCVVCESDLRAFAYIMNLDLSSNRDIVLKKVIEIEKRYCCLKENYPFEGEFRQEFPNLFYQINLFYGSKFLAYGKVLHQGIDNKLLMKNLFKLLFVLKYSFLLSNEEENGCLNSPVYFAGK